MINRAYKDRLFTFLFGGNGHKEWTLSLYNAVNGTHYTDAEEIELATIEEAVYMGMKNDAAFLFRSIISLYEQQSTYNPNMPVRMLMYLGRLYDKYIRKTKQNIYGKRIVRLPVPKLVVFYNGTDETGEETELHLRDAFPEGVDTEQSDVTVRVRMLNINRGKNRELMALCRPLEEYAWFVGQVRGNRETMSIEEAVNRALDEMPEGYEIRPFLYENRAEVTNMCITEYNEAETMEMFREEARAEGLAEGRVEGRAEGRLNELTALVREGLLTAAQAAARLGEPEQVFAARLKP